MKKIIYMSCLVIIGMIFLGGTSADVNLYDEVRKNSNSFTQGLKIQYQLEEKEYQALKNIDGLEIYDNNLYYVNNKKDYFVELKCINYFLEVEVTNIKNDIKIEDVEKILTKKLKNKNNLKIFTYVKSKVGEGHSLKKLSYIENSKKVNIDNGETGIIKLKDESIFNYSIMNYGKDDNYIIVGSPVIFISY
ncbi:MAG: hypothetical protein ACRDDL_01175 [Sarcina sp.]